MKRLLLGLALFLVAALRLHAQGTVTFSNFGAPVTNDLTGQPIVAGTVFKAALYYLPATGAAGETAPTSADFDAFGVTLNPSGGFLMGGIFNLGARTAPTMPAGGFGWFQVRAWETAFGTSYEQARDNSQPIGGRHAYIGTSNIIRVDTGDPSKGTDLPGLLLPAGLKGFCVYGLAFTHSVACGAPVPEPGVFWLGCFGLSTLLVLCRRKN